MQFVLVWILILMKCFCQAQAASTSNTSPIKDASPIKDTVETQAPPLKSQKCYIWSYRFLPCLKGDFEARCLVMQFIYLDVL